MEDGKGTGDEQAGKAPGWRRLLIAVPAIAGAAVLAYAIAARKPPAQSPAAELARHVRVIAAAKTDVVPRVSGFGAVRPGDVWHAVAQVGGKVVFVAPEFEKGAIVSAGTEIVRIDDTDYNLAIAEAEANIRATEARLEELKVTEANLQALLKIEQQSWKIKQAQLARKRALVKRGSAPQASVDQEERDALAQRTRLADIENSIRLLPTQRSVQEEQIAVYRSKLETARLNLSRTVIRVPFRGRIAEANVEETRYVQPGATLGIVDGIQTSEVEAQFPVVQVATFARTLNRNGVERGFLQNMARLMEQAGIHAVLRLDMGARTIEWRGRIVRASDTMDPETRTVGIISAVDGSYDEAVPGERPPLTKGMFVEVELRAPPLPGRFVVPRSAVRDGKVLIANADDRLEIRAVETGIAFGSIAVIDKGLDGGERVVVSDVTPAVPGMKLAAVEDRQLAALVRAEAAGKGGAP